jgi:hypothetical protein
MPFLIVLIFWVSIIFANFSSLADPKPIVIGASVHRRKRLELLRELVAALRKMAYLWEPPNPMTKKFGEEVRKAADALGIIRTVRTRAMPGFIKRPRGSAVPRQCLASHRSPEPQLTFLF